METKKFGEHFRNLNYERILLLFILIHLVYAIFWCCLKTDLFIDEYWTYGLANHAGDVVMTIENGKEYAGTGPFDKFFTVGVSQAFDYANVWAQQEADVHPPFYYVIIHTICSFFPGVFSKWFGLIPNLFCLPVIDILLYQIGKIMFGSRARSLMAVIVYGFGAMMMNMIIFIRMYALLTVAVLAAVFLFLWYFEREKDRRFWLYLYLISIIGTLVQYYFLIVLFFLCLFQGIVFLWRRKWKDVLCFLLTLTAAGVSSVLIFPAMLDHIFGSGYRGQEAWDNIVSVDNLAERIVGNVGWMARELFGGRVVMVLFFLAIGVLLFGRKGRFKSILKEISLQEYMVLCMTVCYLAVIIKIAPFRADRYIMCVGWCLIFLSMDLLHRLLCLLKKDWKYEKICVLGFLVFLGLNVSSMIVLKGELPFSYLTNRELREQLSQYKDSMAVYIYEDSWTLCNHYEDLPLFQKYMFVNYKEFPEIMEARNETGIVLYVSTSSYEGDAIVDEILSSGQRWKEAEFLCTYGMANVYYLWE